MSRRRSLELIALVLIFANPGLASAQDDPRKAQSTPYFEEGLRLADHGRSAEALEKFKKAYELYPSPNTLVNIARAEQLVGRRLDAIGHYRESLKNPVLLPQNAAHAKQWISELEPQLSRLTVNGPAGTKINIGAKELRLPMAEPLDVEPGAIVVKVDRDGRTTETAGKAVPGQLLTIEITAKPTEQPPPQVTPPIEPPPVAPEGPSVARWVVPGIVGIVGLAGVGVGIGFAAKSQSSKTTYDDRECETKASSGCDSLHDDVSTQKTVSIVGYASGFALIASAAVLWWLWPHNSAGQQRGSMWVLPQVGAGHAGASLGGSF